MFKIKQHNNKELGVYETSWFGIKKLLGIIKVTGFDRTFGHQFIFDETCCYDNLLKAVRMFLIHNEVLNDEVIEANKNICSLNTKFGKIKPNVKNK